MGALLLGATAQLTGSSSSGVFSLIILFMVGIVILRMVPEPKVVEELWLARPAASAFSKMPGKVSLFPGLMEY